MKLYEKISLLRKQRGLSQEDLANKLEISRQSVHKWEQGLSYPEIDKIKKLAQIFGVSIDALLNDEMDISAPEAKVSKSTAYRSVFVSNNILKSTHSDYDHHTTDRSKRRTFTVPRSVKNTFALRQSEIEAQISERGYDCVIAPQHDLNVRFFTDNKRNVCGFFYDGAEQFVLPIENIIDAVITDDRTTLNNLGIDPYSAVDAAMPGLDLPRRFILSITYFNKGGKIETYDINFFCVRMYFQFMGRSSKTPAFINALSISTQQSLIQIRNKIIALKSAGEAIRESFDALEDIDAEALLKQSEEALKIAEYKRALVEKQVKKTNIIFISLITAEFALVAAVLIWIIFF